MWKIGRMQRLSSPSRLRYFVQLIYLNRLSRDLINLLGVPIVLAIIAIIMLNNSSNQQRLSEFLSSALSAFEATRDFSLGNAVINGASPEVRMQVVDTLSRIEASVANNNTVELVRSELMTLPMVKDISVTVRDGGTLMIDIIEKLPVLIWHIDDEYVLIDRKGDRLRSIPARDDHPDLHLVSGIGAERNVEEALAIFNESWDLLQMTRGLVRVGERRWDIVLDRGRLIMLPEKDPIDALRLLNVVEQSKDILARNLSVIDLRIPGKLVVRMRPGET